MDQNQIYGFGLSTSLFCILHNITTVVSIILKGHGFECGFYARLIVTNIFINPKLFYGGGRQCKSSRGGNYTNEVIRWMIELTIVIFFVCDLVGILIYTIER